MKPPILLLFQTFYSWRRGRLKHPTYGLHEINHQNATYSRVIPYLAPHFEIRMTDCSPIIGTRSSDKFPTDHTFVQSAVEQRDWLGIISFGRQADEALDYLQVDHWPLPHPVSYQWRRDLIIETRDVFVAYAQEVHNAMA